MKKNNSNYIIAIKVMFCLSIGLFFFGLTGNKLYASGDYNECFARCDKLTGQGKYNCIKICLKTVKKRDYGKSNSVKKKIDECKEICSVYTGIENVKCLRICLDKNSSINSGSNKTEEIDPKKKECEERCKVLTGSLKYKCLKKCIMNLK